MSPIEQSNSLPRMVETIDEDESCVSIDTLYRRHFTEIRNFIARKFGAGPPEPEDITQSTFEKVASAGVLGTIKHPRPYLYRVAYNIAISKYRRVKTSNIHLRSLALDIENSTDEIHPERVLLTREQFKLFESAYRTLTQEQQELLVMHRIHGLSYAEIARRKSISQTQVKRVVARAVVVCQEYIDRGMRATLVVVE